MGCIIENRDARVVMSQHDSQETLHFVDPPYVLATRSDPSKDYAFELSDEDHVDLIEFLRELQGAVVLCGYPSELYDGALEDWHRVDRAALADGAKPRTECLWLNEAAAKAVAQRSLFG